MLIDKDRKMKQKNFFAITILLFIFLALLSFCKRNGVQEPSPFGPSTYAIQLKLEASPNVIFAGNKRETTIITATLRRFNGSPVANTDIHFDIRDAAGNKANIGFFEGNESVKTRTTDQNGTVSISYFGPFSQELTTDSTIYIAALVAWKGNQFINELAPIYLIKNAVDLTFTLIADPNVLLVSETRPQSQLKVFLKTVDGVPLAGRNVYFEIVTGPGTFVNNERRTLAQTDANGYAFVLYIGPTKDEIETDQVVTIQAQPESTTPFSIQQTVDIQLIREEATYPPQLSIEASPNVIIAGDTRESTTVTATLTRTSGVPIANTDIHFEIRDENGDPVNLGFFEGNRSVITGTTDQNGNVSVIYYGPFSHELTEDTTVYIAGLVAWEGDTFVTEQAPVYLIREAVDLSFTLIADPNVLLVTDSHPTSQLKAYLKTVDGVPLSGRKIYFDILSGPGEFAGGTRRTFATTDSSGFATVTYFGPLISEIDSDQTVTIQGQPETSSPFDIQEQVDIQLIREESVPVPQLSLTASPNVLVAGDERESSTVTATLKWLNETPVPNTEIHLDIRDAAGNQLDLGSFASDTAVTTIITLENGTATVRYFGPLSSELTSNTTIYITATVAWEGDVLITQQTPIYLIQDETSEVPQLQLSAQPNALLAGTSRESSTIMATLTWANSTPVPNTDILLDIRDVSGNRLDLGFFASDDAVTTITTFANGTASVIYFGPLSSELATSTTIYIWATVAWEGDVIITQQTPIHIIVDSLSLVNNISINPQAQIATADHSPLPQEASFIFFERFPLIREKSHIGNLFGF